MTEKLIKLGNRIDRNIFQKIDFIIEFLLYL